MEGYLSSRGLSELRRNRSILLGFYSDLRSDRRSFASIAHGGMVSLQRDGDAGLRDHCGASRHRHHNRLLSQCGDGYTDDGLDRGRLFPAGNLRAQHHLN